MSTPVTNFIHQGLSSEGIYLLHSLLKMEVRWCSQQLLLVPILSQINSLDTLKCLYMNINFNIYFRIGLLPTFGSSAPENGKWGISLRKVLTSVLSRPTVSTLIDL